MDTTVDILQGDCIERLRDLPDESVQCCITSPPYWGLRDYGVDGQIGLESSVDAYLAAMVSVFREVRRVLRPDGTLWLNLGDSYVAHPGQRKTTDKAGTKQQTNAGSPGAPSRYVPSLKPKDLIGLPWRVAFALQADGWYLRADIVWNKPNAMPESVKDRPTKSHEYLFLLSKRERYYYNAEAVKEPVTGGAHSRGAGVNPKAYKTPSGWNTGPGGHHVLAGPGRYAKTPGKNSRLFQDRDPAHPTARKSRQNPSWSASVTDTVATRNKRTVWTVATAPCKDAHFATYPPKLIEPCILAGSRPGDVVLDPFGGAGTTAMVASRHGRRSILIELNPDYIEIARKRLTLDERDALIVRYAA